MIHLHHAMSAIAQSAQRVSNARWHVIQLFLGTSLRTPYLSPLSEASREPLAPGFAAVPGEELFASTFCEIDIREALGADPNPGIGLWGTVEASMDAACYRLECQIRAALQGSLAQKRPPAIELSDGDRIYPVPLVNATGPIRYRITQLSDAKVRVDLEVLLRRATARECCTAAASRLTPESIALIESARQVSPALRILMDASSLADGQRVVVVAGIGNAAAEILEQASREIIALPDD